MLSPVPQYNSHSILHTIIQSIHRVVSNMGTAFRWQDVCIYIISMASSREQRASVQRQLRSEGLPHARVWPGVVVDHNEERSHNLLRKLADLCIVPRSYAEEAVLPEMRGTIGSSVAHLSLLYHVHRHDDCGWVMVLADDVRCSLTVALTPNP